MRCPLCGHEDEDLLEIPPLTPEEEARVEERSREWREAHDGMTVSEILLESLEAPNPFFKYLAEKGNIDA
jgi:hypothetical protein